MNGKRVKRFRGSDARIYVHGERTKMCIVQSYARASVEETEKGERSRGSWENLGSVRRRKTMEQRSNRLMMCNRRCLCFFLNSEKKSFASKKKKARFAHETV